jgi:AraC family transcriptional regulator, transcriptional activator FtrA
VNQPLVSGVDAEFRKNHAKNSTLADTVVSRRVVVIAYDRLCTFEYGIAAEVFGFYHPGLEGSWYEFQTAASEGGRLRTNTGLVVDADGGLELLDGAGTIIVPGWRRPRVIPPSLPAALSAAYQNGSRIVSICGGAFALAEAGLLAGRRATTHWQSCEELARRYPDIRVEPDVLYIDEGDILTSAGSAAGIDLCLHIVRRDYGPKAANVVARCMVVPPHRGGGQAQYVQRPVMPDPHSPLSPLLDWMRTSVGDDLSLACLSSKAGMSPRTFIRHFAKVTGVAPGEWILNERISQACDLLETTKLGIDEVAYRSGLGSAATLRHHFRRRFNSSPSMHRFQFSRV